MANEFEQLDDEFESAPTGVPIAEAHGNLSVSSGSRGEVYDWNDAPEGVKAPPRVDMNGMVVTIKKADLVLPPMSSPWKKTFKGDKDVKPVSFVLHYDKDGQQEYYSGVRVFKTEDGKYSHPTITRDKKNQASELLGKYADFKKKSINEVSLKEFMAFLNGMPKAKIQSKEFENPQTKEKIRKNMVVEFV